MGIRMKRINVLFFFVGAIDNCDPFSKLGIEYSQNHDLNVMNHLMSQTARTAFRHKKHI